MGEIGNAAVGSLQGARNGQKLPANPDAKHQPGRKIDETNKDDDQNKGPDRRSRMKHEIGPEDTRNAA